MSIRQALRRQADLASQPRGKEPRRWRGFNPIFLMTAGVLAIVCAIKILFG